ncbi:MAG: acyl-phosphate glycerol 3-phosphate acyltransferase [Leptothrix sp. (in: Bacteria)]|nr:acyl-phosphate glycerol 3-phosphate acyltransferase [Leptothrix sp. (in: b-proteobacteria)]
MDAPVVQAQARLLAVVGALLRELRGVDAPAGLDDALEATLGIDSLARMELMVRLERAFDVRLPEALVQQAQTPRDLLRALQAGMPASAAGPPPVVEPVPAPPAAAPPEASLQSAPAHAQTMLEVLRWQAQARPQHAHVRLLDAEGGAAVLTAAQLLQRGRAVARGLRQRGLAESDCVALMLPTGHEFFVAFAGIWLAGGVPVPIYPPLRAAQIEDHLRRQARILDNAGAVLLIADARTQPAARLLRAGAGALRGVATVAQLEAAGGPAAAEATPEPASAGDAARRAGDIALLQYTSGSTGQPKGVVMTHANLLASIRAMAAGVEARPGDVFVSWLPLYHDMGLIGAWMGSLYVGMSLVLMAPQDFLARPARWLHALHAHRGTISAAPNFAYEIVAGKLGDAELQGLDLRSWRAAFNGAEPVQAATLRRFAERFARHGFDPHAMLPVYGLAETGLGLTFPPLGRGPKVDTIDRAALRSRRRAVAVAGSAGDRGLLQVVSCGVPLPGHEVRVVDARGAEAPERCEGRVEFRGPSATPGYYRNPEATRALFDGDWLDTGDVGYIAQGELYLTSRVKDLIIRGGHNIHPYELEEAVGALPGVRKGCVAVLGAADATSATDRVVVVAETHEADEARRTALRARIAELALTLLGMPADEVMLVPPHSVPKTSSGKIRRAACRELVERRALSAPRRALWLPLARLGASAAAMRVRAALLVARAALYAAWLWLLFALGALAATATLSWLPGLVRRQRVARRLARALLAASGLPLQVGGAEHLQGVRPMVVVANHASYLDWLLLTALLPAQVCAVAKRELGRRAALGWLLRRVGVRFVARDDVQGGVEDSRRLRDAAAHGVSLAFFPEGTLSREPGLRPFHMGAFIVAADSGLPLLVLSLRGTRSVLRDGSWWPRRHALVVQAHAPLAPQGPGWQGALALRDAARRILAAECGEPDRAAPQGPA